MDSSGRDIFLWYIVQLFICNVLRYTMSQFRGCLLCTARPKQQKTNQAHRVVEDLFAESQTSAPAENRQKPEPVPPRADTHNDDDLFADTFSSSFKTKSKAGISKPAVVTEDDDIFASALAASAVKSTRHTLQSKKAPDITNAFNIDNDDDDDIFAIKPSSVSTVKNPVAAAGNACQKVGRLCLQTFLTITSLQH